MGVAAEPPFKLTLVKVVVAPAKNCAEVEAAIVKVPVVEAAAPKMMD
jgi:hypothetical protein